jgi:hypothetical protein
VIRAACRALQTLPVTPAPYEPVGRPRGGQTNHVLAKPPRAAGGSPKDPQPAPVAVRYGQPSFEFRIRPTRGRRRNGTFLYPSQPRQFPGPRRIHATSALAGDPADTSRSQLFTYLRRTLPKLFLVPRTHTSTYATCPADDGHVAGLTFPTFYPLSSIVPITSLRRSSPRNVVLRTARKSRPITIQPQLLLP